MTFDEIETLREHWGILQKALCVRAGVAESTYTRIKQGGKNRQSTLRALARALHDEIDERLKSLEQPQKAA